MKKKDGKYWVLDMSYRVYLKDDFSAISVNNKEYPITNIIPILDFLFIHNRIDRMLKELGIPEDEIKEVSNDWTRYKSLIFDKKGYEILKEIYEEAKIDYIISEVEKYLSQSLVEVAANVSGFNLGFFIPYEPAPYAKLRSPVRPEFLEISYDTNYVIMTPSAMALLSWVKKSFVDFMKDKHNVVIETGTQSAINEEITEIGSEVYEISSKNLYSTLEKEYVHKKKGIIVSAVIVPVAYVNENEVLSGKIIEALPKHPIKIYKEIWKVIAKPNDKYPDYYAYISAYGTALYIKKSKDKKEVETKKKEVKVEKYKKEEVKKKEEPKKEEPKKEKPKKEEIEGEDIFLSEAWIWLSFTLLLFSLLFLE